VSEIELEIGEVLLIGDFTLTVVDIDRDDVTFKIDQSESGEEMLVTLSQEMFAEAQELESTSAVNSVPR
jgi:hypothetical protein